MGEEIVPVVNAAAYAKVPPKRKLSRFGISNVAAHPQEGKAGKTNAAPGGNRFSTPEQHDGAEQGNSGLKKSATQDPDKLAQRSEDKMARFMDKEPHQAEHHAKLSKDGYAGLGPKRRGGYAGRDACRQ